MKRYFVIVITAIILTNYATLPASSEDKKDANSTVMSQAWRAGRQFVESGYYKKATAFLESYLQIVPESSDGWYWLAKAYQGRGMIERAQAAFTKTLEIDPEYPPLSRVLQNRATGEAIPLWDPAGNRYRKGLPVIDTAKLRKKEEITAKPLAPNRYSEKQVRVIKPQQQSFPEEINSNFSPLGGKKVIILPPSALNEFHKKSVDHPGIPRIDIQGEEPIYNPPVPPSKVVE